MDNSDNQDDEYKYASYISDESESDDSEIKSDRSDLSIQIDKVFLGLPPLCHCVICFKYMGDMNPRQYCCKTICPYEYYELLELSQIRIDNLRENMDKNDYRLDRAVQYLESIRKIYS